MYLFSIKYTCFLHLAEVFFTKLFVHYQHSSFKAQSTAELLPLTRIQINRLNFVMGSQQ